MPTNAFGDEVETNGFGDPVEHTEIAPTPTAPTGRAVLKGMTLAPVPSATFDEPLPDSEPMGVVPMPPPQDAALAAFKAKTSGLSPDQGAAALDHATQTGLGPIYVAKNLDVVQQQADNANLKTALSVAPATASYAAQSPAHAAAIKDDADNLSFLEWIFGKYERTPITQQPAPFATAGIDYPLPQTQAGDMLVPPMWESHWAKGMLALRASLLGIKRDVGGLTTQDRANIAQAEESAATPVPGEEGHIVREAVGASVEALPQMAGFLISAPAFLLAQTYGSLRNHFAEQTKDDGTPKYTENQARALATGGAVATTAILGGAARKFAGGTVGKLLPTSARQALSSTATDALLDLMAKSPELAANLTAHAVRFGQHALNGLMFMVGLSTIENLTDQTGDVLTGGRFDPSKAVQAAQHAAEASLLLLPLMAIGTAAGLFHDIGRAHKAHTDALDLAAQIEAAKASKLIKRSPEQARALLEAQSDGTGHETAYIPVAAFDAAMAEAKLDPADVAADLTGDPDAHRDAQLSGDLAVPMPALLTTLAPEGHADALLPDIKRDADGMTLREAVQYQEAWHGTPHQFARFDMSKMGSGEGAQSWGRGLYFAEERLVAEHYRRALSEDENKLAIGIVGKEPTEAQRAALNMVSAHWANRPEVTPREAFEDRLAYLKKQAEEFGSDGYWQKLVAGMESLKDEQLHEVGAGHLYRAAIPPKSELLDYEAQLNEQPPEIRERALHALRRDPAALNFAKEHYAFGFDKEGEPTFLTGSYLYKSIANTIGEENATRYLREAGIPGLQYLDEKSRQSPSPLVDWMKAQGLVDERPPPTRNFVIWDDSRVRMLANDQPLELAGLYEALTKERARALYGAIPADEQIGLNQPIAADLTPEQAKQLEGKQNAKATTPERIRTPPSLRAQIDALPDKAEQRVLNDLWQAYRTALDNGGDADAYWQALQAEAQRVGIAEPTPEPTQATPAAAGATPPAEPPVAAAEPAPEQPKRSQPPQLAAAAARAKEARDFDLALAAYAADRIAKLKIADLKPYIYEQQARLLGARMMVLAKELGSARAELAQTKVITPQNTAGEPATYKLVEASDLIASHKPESFSPNPAYPNAVQERDYLGTQLEQQKVAKGGRFLNPALVLADTPTAVDGPPLVTSGPKAIVLGGNGRSMMLQRAYAEGEPGEKYREALRKKATHFGIAPEAVEAMKQPVLVRSIDAIPDTSERQAMVGAVRRYNEGLTQVLSPRLRAVAEARVLTPQTVASIGELLGNGDTSLRELLREKPQDFLRILERDGIVNDTDRAQFVRGGELTDEAKDRIEGMFLGRVMGSGERLEATAPSLQAKVERAVPALLRVAGSNPTLDEIGDVQGALDLINDAARRGLPLEDLLGQRTMFVEGRVEPRTLAMARLLEGKTAKDIGARFKAWADLATRESQGGMFDAPAASPEEALGVLFKGQKDDLSGPSRPTDANAPKAPETAPAKAPGVALNEQTAKKATKAKAAEATLSEVQGQHLVSDHLARAATEAKAEAVKVQGELAALAREQVRGDFARGGQPFIDAYDAIMGGIGLRSRMPRAAIDEAVATIRENLGEVGFDPAALKALLSERRLIDRMTVEEAQSVRDALRSIRKGAHDAVMIEVAGRELETADLVQHVRDTLQSRMGGGGGGKELSAASGMSAPRPKGFLGKGKAILTEMLQPQELMRRVGLEDFYHRDFVEGRNYREELSKLTGDHFYRHYEQAMPHDLKARRFEPVEGVGGRFPGEMVRQDLWELASWMGSASSAERASKGLGVTEAEIHRTLLQLDKAEWDFIQSRWDFSDKVLWPMISAHIAEKVGLPPPKVVARPITTRFGEYRGGYNPARYRFDLGRKAGEGIAQDVADAWGDLRKGFPAASDYFTKPRAQRYFDVPDLQWGAFASHLQAVAHYLAFDKFVSNFGRLLRHQGFRNAVREADGLGEEALRQLDEFHRVTARGNVEPAKGGAIQTANLFGGGLMRSRVGTAAFQLNLKVVAGQLSHIVAAMPALGIRPDHMLRGVISALDPRSYKDAFENSRQLGYRWNEYGAKTREMLQGIGPESRSPQGRWVDTAGWALYHWMDGYLSKSIWEAARLKAMGEIESLPAAERVLGGDHEQRQAYDAADKALSQIMPPRNIMEQSSFARDRGVVGSMMLVRNFPNTIYNVSAMQAWDAATAVHDASPGWQKAKAYGGYAVTAASLLGTYLAVHILGRYIMGHGKEEDEKYSQWLLRESLAAPLYQFGPAEDAADPFIRALVSRHSIAYQIKHGHEGFRNAPAIEFFNQQIRDVGDVFEHGPTQKRVFAGLRLFSRLAGGPTAMIPSLQYGYDLARNREHPRNLFELGSGVFYGKRRHQAQNPLTDLSRLTR